MLYSCTRMATVGVKGLNSVFTFDMEMRIADAVSDK